MFHSSSQIYTIMHLLFVCKSRSFCQSQNTKYPFHMFHNFIKYRNKNANINISNTSTIDVTWLFSDDDNDSSHTSVKLYTVVHFCSSSLCSHVCIYIYIHMCVCMCMYIFEDSFTCTSNKAHIFKTNNTYYYYYYDHKDRAIYFLSWSSSLCMPLLF